MAGGSGSEEIEGKRWNHQNPTCVYATDETTTPSSSSSGSFYQSFAPGAIAMARKATLARFLEKRKHSESPNTYVTADDAAEDGEISSTAMLKTATTTDLRIAIFTVFGLLC
nr:protein TIFY 10B-like isoform X1 [Ipomoea batatas]